MAKIPFNVAGQIGVIFGLPPAELPPSAWSAGKNVRMINGSVHKFMGHTAVWDPPSVAPYWLLPVPIGTSYYWLYAGLAKVYTTDMSTHTNITRQTASVDVDYNATAAHGWNGGVLGGIPVINNGVDDPQQWLPAGPATKLAALSNWPPNTKAAVVRPFKNFLVALDVTKTSTRFPYLVKWSHPAVPGAVPTSWDETDPTVDAGEIDLAETSDILIDCRPLRDVNVIYKENTTWGMQFIGAPNVFRFFKMFDEFGTLSRHCSRGFFGKHIVASRGDIVIHNGQQADSIFKSTWAKKMAQAVFASLDSTNYVKAHMAFLPNSYELWFIYPETGSTNCNKALIWNWKENTFSVRDMPNVTYTENGIVDSAVVQTWDSDSDTWDSDGTAWDDRPYNPTKDKLLMASPSSTKLFSIDDTEQFNGSDMLSYIERTDIPMARDRDGSVITGSTQWWLVKEIWPRMRATGPVSIYVGGRNSVNDSVSWGSPIIYDPNTDRYVQCYINSPLPALRIESNSDISWELDGFYLVSEPTSEY